MVSQKLFSLNLSADSAATLLERDPEAARAQLARVRELAREALAELRSLILGLRPADLVHDGLDGALRKEVEMLRRVHGIEVELRADGDPGWRRSAATGRRDVQVLRIAHEALHNAVRHAAAKRVTVHLDGGEQRLILEVSDDGIGFDPFDPELRARHLWRATNICAVIRKQTIETVGRAPPLRVSPRPVFR